MWIVEATDREKARIEPIEGLNAEVESLEHALISFDHSSDLGTGGAVFHRLERVCDLRNGKYGCDNVVMCHEVQPSDDFVSAPPLCNTRGHVEPES